MSIKIKHKKKYNQFKWRHNSMVFKYAKWIFFFRFAKYNI